MISAGNDDDGKEKRKWASKEYAELSDHILR
jgi:hypothetical protein